MPHVPFSAGFLLSGLSCESVVRRSESRRKREVSALGPTAADTAGRGWSSPLGWTDRLVAAVSPGVCSSDRGRISRESYRCGFRGFDSGAQADSQSLHLTPSVAILSAPSSLSLLLFQSLRILCFQPPLLETLSMVLSSWLDDAWHIAFSSNNIQFFGVEVFTQTTLIFLLHSTSNLDIGKELHIPISFNTCYNTWD